MSGTRQNKVLKGQVTPSFQERWRIGTMCVRARWMQAQVPNKGALQNRGVSPPLSSILFFYYDIIFFTAVNTTFSTLINGSSASTIMKRYHPSSWFWLCENPTCKSIRLSIGLGMFPKRNFCIWYWKEFHTAGNPLSKVSPSSSKDRYHATHWRTVHPDVPFYIRPELVIFVHIVQPSFWVIEL